ncbi:MAG: D-alanyl-D-alanine carboxypeptidase [Oscillospiraceae bacterium]|nr:D-alanyl-D-alanine carboxypeptidase [Oscillospiraceae bacterium]
MKKIRRITIIIIIAAVITALFAPAAAALEDPEAECRAAIVTDIASGQILYSKNAYDRLYPASLTKIVTAMVVIDAVNNGEVSLSDTVEFSENAFFDIGKDISSYKFQAGERVKLENLLYCIVMTSANEPCNALAEHVAGTVEAFVQRMNDRVASLGCTMTSYGNTHGLPSELNYTTAYDQSLIIADAMEDPLFSKMAATETYKIPATAFAEERELTSSNNLIRSSSSYYYEYVQGGKTGYTNAAGFCLSSIAQRGEMKLACVVLGAESVIQDSGKPLIKSFSETRRLFRWAFNNFNYRSIVSTLDLIEEIPVELGEGTGTVVLRPERDIIVLMGNDVNVSDVQYKINIYSEEGGSPLTAPVTAGEVLGEAEISLGGVDYGKVKLVANSSVALDRNKYIAREIRNTFDNFYVKLSIVIIIAIFILYIAFIMVYNIRRKQQKEQADKLARERIEEIRAKERQLNSGKTFEEIERRHAREENAAFTRKPKK